MIFYHTDNSISQAVGRAFEEAGHTVGHVDNFHPMQEPDPIFYGILRGTGASILACKRINRSFYYLDNGYFDAIYMDQNKIKDMGGKYRVVKNDLIERYPHLPVRRPARVPLRVLLLPPSPYSAFMYDTTPEDWIMEQTAKLKEYGDQVTIRKKDHANPKSLEDDLKEHDAVLAFNSMSVMKAVEMGMPVWDTHGIFRNSLDMINYYDLQYLKNYYEPKQFTLDEIREGKCTFS